MFSDCNILGVFHILNVCMAFTLVSHSVVCAWRGTWTLIDLYILPSDITVSSAVTAVVGVLILGTGNSLKALCKKYIAPGCTVSFFLLLSFYYALDTYSQRGLTSETRNSLRFEIWSQVRPNLNFVFTKFVIKVHANYPAML